MGKKSILFAMIIFFAAAFTSCGKKAQVSSVELVQQDFENEKITYEDHLVYKAYGVFDHPGLPRKYRSEVLTREGTRTMLEIRKNWDKLSPDAQEKLKPFFAGPQDKESHFHPPRDSGAGLVSLAFADPPDTAGYSPMDTANGKVRIWHKPADKSKALWILESFDKHRIYEKETALMNRVPRSDGGVIGHDGRLDVFLKAINDMGVTVCGTIAQFNKAYAHIIICSTQTKEQVQNSIAHELFHAIQFNIDCHEEPYWMEMSATWIEDFIYPDFDIEHGYLKHYFTNFQTRKSFRLENGKHEYGLYVWPLYLQQKHGPAVIKAIWDEAEWTNVDAAGAFKAAIPGGFEEAFKEFSLWVYNELPAHYFRDGAGAGKFLPAKPSLAEHRISVGGETDWTNLDDMSITIDHLYFGPGDKDRIRSIDFDFSFTQKVFPDIVIWAIVKIKDKPAVAEDWSRIPFHTYCFDMPEEDLETLTLIFGNPSTTHGKTAANRMDYEAKEYGCEAKLFLGWSVQAEGGGDWKLPHQDGSASSLGAYLTNNESGQVDVKFVEKTLKPEDPDDPEIEQVLVPYGGFSYSQLATSEGSMAPDESFESFVLKGGSTLKCQASDIWDGKPESRQGYATLNVKITGPDSEEEISKEEWDLIPKQMREQLKALEKMGDALKAGAGNPKTGELKYDIVLSFGSLPATFTTIIDDVSQEPEEMEITPDTIELEGLFKKTERVIPIERTFRTSVGTIRIQGTLILKKSE